jgi:hypothetical protein
VVTSRVAPQEKEEEDENEDNKYCALSFDSDDHEFHNDSHSLNDDEFYQSSSEFDLGSSSSMCSSSCSPLTTTATLTSVAGGGIGEKRRGVWFGVIEFYEFLPTIGDNPSVSSGVPISLDFSLYNARTVDLELYELVRRPRRTTRELKISSKYREEM